MKLVFIFLMTMIFNLSIFSYEYNFFDGNSHKGLFKNQFPYSYEVETCIKEITSKKIMF